MYITTTCGALVQLLLSLRKLSVWKNTSALTREKKTREIVASLYMESCEKLLNTTHINSIASFETVYMKLTNTQISRRTCKSAAYTQTLG